MTRELITSWSDYRSATDRLLDLAKESIVIYDEDLAQLQIDAPMRIDRLRQFLQNSTHVPCLRIALRNTGSLSRDQPRLLGLLEMHSHRIAVQQTPSQLTHLRDSMLIIDGKYGLIRFDKDFPRSKLLIDENAELAPYCKRFDDIWNEGGEKFSPRPLGL